MFARFLANIGYKFLLLFFAINITFSGIAITSFPRVAHAMPFSCSGDIYQVQDGQLRIFDPVISSYVDVGAANAQYNAVGFNTQDNFAYGSQGNNVIRIAADGTLTTLFNVGFSSIAGDVDDNNTLWLRNTTREYIGVELSTGATTTLTVTGQTTGSADIIILENAGTPFIITITATRIARINLNTGVSTRVNISGLNTSTGNYGASWTDSAGRVFTFHNGSGEIYELSGIFGSSPTAMLVAQGDPSSNNDGFSCDQAPFPTLPPLAMDDDFTGPLNVDVTGNILVDNGNGIDEDPDGGPLTITTTPVSPPSNGSVILLPNGDFTYTPNLNFIGVDTFEYRISDQSGLMATATVTITITGTFAFTVAKTQTSGPNPITAAGQVIGYEIELDNTGDIPLSGIVVDDTLPDGSSGAAVLQSGDLNIDGNLDVAETFIYSISYTVTQADIDNLTNLVNQVSVTTTQTGATAQTSSATTPVLSNPSIAVTKVAFPRTDVPVGTSITYTYTVTNDGNVTISNVDLSDAHSGFGAPPVPNNETLSSDAAPLGDSIDTSVDGVWDVLRPGDAVQFTANYVVTQQDIDAQ